MQTLKVLIVEAVPRATNATRERIPNRLAYIPNFMATFAHSPALLDGYIDAAFRGQD